MVKFVLFDFDGTIINSIPLIIETYLVTYQQFHLTPPPVEQIKQGIGVPLRTYVADTVPHHLIEPFVKAFKAFNLAHLTTHIGIFVPAWHLITKLHQKQIPMGVLTSKRRDATYISLDQFGLTPYFQWIQTADDTKAHKPDPQPLWEAIAGFNRAHHQQIKPEETIYIGDNTMDVLASNRAGCQTGIVAWTQMDHQTLEAVGPFRWIHTIEDLDI